MTELFIIAWLWIWGGFLVWAAVRVSEMPIYPKVSYVSTVLLWPLVLPVATIDVLIQKCKAHRP